MADVKQWLKRYRSALTVLGIAIAALPLVFMGEEVRTITLYDETVQYVY